MSSSRKPSWIRLPCIRCATEIPELIEGVTLRCLQCGADNTYTESSKFLEKLAQKNLGAVPSIDFIKDHAFLAKLVLALLFYKAA